MWCLYMFNCHIKISLYYQSKIFRKKFKMVIGIQKFSFMAKRRKIKIIGWISLQVLKKHYVRATFFAKIIFLAKGQFLFIFLKKKCLIMLNSNILHKKVVAQKSEISPYFQHLQQKFFIQKISGNKSTYNVEIGLFDRLGKRKHSLFNIVLWVIKFLNRIKSTYINLINAIVSVGCKLFQYI